MTRLSLRNSSNSVDVGRLRQLVAGFAKFGLHPQHVDRVVGELCRFFHHPLDHVENALPEPRVRPERMMTETTTYARSFATCTRTVLPPTRYFEPSPVSPTPAVRHRSYDGRYRSRASRITEVEEEDDDEEDEEDAPVTERPQTLFASVENLATNEMICDVPSPLNPQEREIAESFIDLAEDPPSPGATTIAPDKLQTGVEFYREQLNDFAKYAPPEDQPSSAGNTYVPAAECCICRGLCVDLHQSALVVNSSTRSDKQAVSPSLFAELFCYDNLQIMRDACGGAKELTQPEVLQYLQAGLKACSDWQTESEFAKRRRNQAVVLWAASVGLAVHLLLQQFRLLPPATDRTTASEWLGRILAATPDRFMYRGRPLTAALAKKFTKVSRLFLDRPRHWVMHSGLALSSLYNCSEEQLGQIDEYLQ